MKLKGILLAILCLMLTAQVNAQVSQDVQDTFMGMKLGTRLSEATIKANVGSRGEYKNISDNVTFTRISFSNTYFAGHKWHFAYFYRNVNNELYEFEVTDHFDYSSEALIEYNAWKEKLDNKYVSTVLEDETDSKLVAYFGDKGVGAMLSYEYSKSTGGTYYYYISIYYIHEELFFSVQNANNDEL